MSPLLDVIDRLPPGRALDLACGSGRWAHELAARGWEVMAIDRDDDALAQVRTPKMKMDLERGEPLPFPDAAFDLVLIVRFLHRPLFDEAERVLKPGGVLIAEVLTTGRFAISPTELDARFAGWERVAALGETTTARPSYALAVRRPD